MKPIWELSTREASDLGWRMLEAARENHTVEKLLRDHYYTELGLAQQSVKTLRTCAKLNELSATGGRVDLLRRIIERKRKSVPPANRIEIIVEGGIVQDVLGLPKDWEVEIHDYDVEGADPECDDIDEDDDGLDFVRIRWGQHGVWNEVEA